MKVIGSYAFSIATWLKIAFVLALSFSPINAVAGTTILNFDVDANGNSIVIPPFGTIDATTYFAGYGITLSDITPGGMVVIRNDASSFISPPSPPNTMSFASPCCPAVSWALNFPAPLSSISFTRPLLRAGPSGVTHPQWTATAYDSSGNVVATAGQVLIASFSDVPAQTFTLSGSGITKLLFTSNGFHFASTIAVVIDDLTLVTSGCQVNANDVKRFVGGPVSLDKNLTSMNATFVPTDANGMPVGLTVAAAACGFANFNWQQKVTFLPVPSPPAFAESAPNIPLTAPPPYNDPPPGGYTYQAQDPGLNFTPNQAYPFYYDTNASVSYPLSLGANIKNNGHTLLFYDAPADPCLPGGSPSLVAQYCGGATAPPGSYIRFTTALVGVLQGNTLGPVLYTWDWKDSFNGTSGGIPVIDNYRQVDPGSGTGGITITSINGVTQTPPSVSCAATPNTLWPPNGKLAEVILSGTITPGTQPIPAFGTTYVVTDEYGQFQPSGNISLSAGGSYSLGVSLIAERNGQDLDGRAYTVTVIAADGIGNVGSCSAVVTVPHDKSR